MTDTAQTFAGFEEKSVPVPVPVFKKDAEQSYEFTIEDDDARYELTQVFKGLPDNVLAEFDRLRELSLEGDGKTTDLKTNSVAADEYLFDQLCVDVRGYDGEKPENWKDLVPYDEKKAGISKLLAIKIVTDNSEKAVKKRSWGATRESNVVELQSYFSGKPVTTKVTFIKKTPADVAAYAVLKNRISLIDRGIDESSMKIPASMKRKAELFDKLEKRIEGYDGEPPLHHKAAFVSGLFEPRIASTEKK